MASLVIFRKGDRAYDMMLPFLLPSREHGFVGGMAGSGSAPIRDSDWTSK